MLRWLSEKLHFLSFYLFSNKKHQEFAWRPFWKLALQYYNHLARADYSEISVFCACIHPTQRISPFSLCERKHDSPWQSYIIIEQLFVGGEANIVEKSPRRSRGDYSTIFTEPEENNCFNIIAQVIIRAIAFSFILLFILQKHQEIARRPFWKLVLQYYNHLARGDYSEIWRNCRPISARISIITWAIILNLYNERKCNCLIITWAIILKQLFLLGEYCRIIPSTSSRELFDNIHFAFGE